MNEIYLCLLKTFKWISLVYQHRQNHQQHHNQTHIMLYFIHFSVNKKQYAAKTIAHGKHIITLLNQHNIMSATLFTIW